MWFEKEKTRDGKLRGFGCGVVALHDLVAYKGYIRQPEGQNEFKERIRKIEKGGVYVFPHLGIAPYFYPYICDLYLMRHHFPIRLKWGWSARREYKKDAADIKKCLDNNPWIIDLQYLLLYH